MSEKEARIRDRAYSIWQSQGGIHGRHEDHWHQAESELEASEAETFQDPADTQAADLGPEAPQFGTESRDGSPQVDPGTK